MNVWTTKPLIDVATLQRGFDLPTRERIDGDVPLISSSGISDTHSRSAVLGPGVVTGRSGSIGNVFYVDRDFWPLNTVLYVRDFHGNDPRFIYYLLTWFDLGRFATGAGVPTLNRNFFHDEPVSVPPVPEQQRIVGILDKAFEAVAAAKANAEQNVQNARAVFENELEAIFSQRGEGWIEKSLEEIGSTQTGSTPKTSEPANYGDFVPFIKPGDFNEDGSLDYDNEGLSEIGMKAARTFRSGSVLMVCIGATIGKCGYCDRDVTANQQINALTPNDGSSGRFIYYQMRTESFQRRVAENAGQATLPIINKSKWSALTIWLPQKPAEREAVTKRLDSVAEQARHLAAIYENKVAVLGALKKSLLDKAFSGQL